MTYIKNRSVVWLVAVMFGATAMSQTVTVAPNDPMLKTLRNIEVSEWLTLKDFCEQKYPQLATSLESQLAARLQAVYGLDYTPKAKKFAASRQFKAEQASALTAYKAWPENVQSSRCQNLPPALVYEGHIIAEFRRMAEENMPSLVHYVHVCNTLYPGEKFSQTVLNESIKNLYGEGPQAQRKYAAFLAKPETQEKLASDLKFFEALGWRRDNYKDQCFSYERRFSGVLLPTKVPQPN